MITVVHTTCDQLKMKCIDTLTDYSSPNQHGLQNRTSESTAQTATSYISNRSLKVAGPPISAAIPRQTDEKIYEERGHTRSGRLNWKAAEEEDGTCACGTSGERSGGTGRRFSRGNRDRGGRERNRRGGSRRSSSTARRGLSGPSIRFPAPELPWMHGE